MIKNFNTFVNESYLKGSRQPIYHLTAVRFIAGILNSDSLMTSVPTFTNERYEKSLSLTRDKDIYLHFDEVCFELDYDKLLNDGYKAHPVDEFYLGGDSPRKEKNPETKSRINQNRGGKHGIDSIDKSEPLIPFEYEERIYKSIRNLSKYLISIQLKEKALPLMYKKTGTTIALRKYLNNHTGVKLYKTSNESFRKNIEDITHNFKIEYHSHKKIST